MEHGEYRFDQETFAVTDDIKSTFDELGCILIRGLLDTDEINLINEAVSCERFQKEAYGVPDANGIPCFVSLWNQPGNDITGMVARSEKVAGTVEKLMGSEMYHYHSKIMMKDALNSGGFEWHQDYGYWYHNGLLYPDCAFVWIALDKSTRENGCMQILQGSQKCGRIEHVLVQGQSKADDTRVEELKRRCPLKYAEMEPGDALFLHCNTLHHSDPNTSPMRRWAMVCCYNMASNNPTFEHHHSSYVPLKMVPNSAIKDCKTPFDLNGKEFMDPSKIKSGQLRYIRRGESVDALRG